MQNVNFPFFILSDIIVLVLLIAFALLGRKRGLVKMISGVLVLVLSITFSGMLTKWTTPYISSTFVQPYITQVLLPDAQNSSDTSAMTEDTNTSDMSSTLSRFGLSNEAITTAIENFKKEAVSSVENAISSLSKVVSEKVTYSITFIIYLLILLLVFSILVRLLNLAAKLPVISFFNSTGGLILGAVWGYLIILVVATLLIKFNILLSAETVANTTLLKFILTKNPLTLLPIWN